MTFSAAGNFVGRGRPANAGALRRRAERRRAEPVGRLARRFRSPSAGLTCLRRNSYVGSSARAATSDSPSSRTSGRADGGRLLRRARPGARARARAALTESRPPASNTTCAPVCSCSPSPSPSPCSWPAAAAASRRRTTPSSPSWPSGSSSRASARTLREGEPEAAEERRRSGDRLPLPGARQRHRLRRPAVEARGAPRPASSSCTAAAAGHPTSSSTPSCSPSAVPWR